MRARVLMNASDGPIKLQSTENLILQSTSVIPQNSSFFGTAVSRGNRLFIKLNSLVFPNNSQYSLQAQALDFEDKKIGVRGSRLGNKALKAFGVFSLNVLSQSGMALSKKEYLGGSDSGEVHIKPSLENALLYGASSASSESIKDYSKELKNTPSQVLVKQGRKVLILFTDPIKKINHGG